MNKKLILSLFTATLLFLGFAFGGNTVNAAENNTSKITYNYVDFNTLTTTQKNSIIKGNPDEINKNDFENYSFVYQKNDSQMTVNTGDNNSGNTGSTNNTPNGQNLLKTGDIGSNIYLIILGFVLLGGGITLLTLKKKKAHKFLLFLIMFTGASLLAGPIVQAVENSNLKPQETTTVTKGTKETKKPGNIEGYTYVGYIHTSKNDTTPTPPPVEQGSVTVNYQDEQGNSLAPSETLKGDVGKTYKTAQKDIEGYDFKEVQGNATGEFTTKAQVVTYIYIKTPVPAANLTIEYLDENGNQIHEPKIISGNIGDPYDVTGDMDELQIEGYTIDTNNLPTNAKGVLSNEPIQVKYIYIKNVKDVTLTIKFINRQTGGPFVLDDLTKIQNGDLVPLYPNLDQYHMQLDYNNQLYNQGEAVPDIVIQGKEGDSYSLPERMTFNIVNDKGNVIPYVIGPPDEEGASYGIINWENIILVPDNIEGTLSADNTVVTYSMDRYPIQIAPPTEDE
ncbi:cell surface protein [Listeria welshimeri]|nr:cell surface protein [Listeria welshimeri]